MILIDADILVYRIGYSTQDLPEDQALRRLNGFIEDLFTQLRRNREEVNYDLYLTGSTNFRFDYAVTAPYKGNRKSEKPVHFKAIREHLLTKWDAILTVDEEADDAIAIAATLHGDDSITVSLDKDFDQVKGWHYNFAKKNLYYVTEEEGLNFLYRQVLMGDAVDNIIGVRGIGKVKSAKLLEDCVTEIEYYDKVVELMGCGERVIENLRLLYLRRNECEIWVSPYIRTERKQ